MVTERGVPQLSLQRASPQPARKPARVLDKTSRITPDQPTQHPSIRARDNHPPIVLIDSIVPVLIGTGG